MKEVWEQVGNRANHYIDVEVLAMTAADMLKAYNFRDPTEEGSEKDRLEKDHFTCEDLQIGYSFAQKR